MEANAAPGAVELGEGLADARVDLVAVVVLRVVRGHGAE
jgi:hypothetical protein